MTLWSFILAGIGILGLWMAGNKNKYGWALGIFAQFLWAGYSIVTLQYGFLISCFGYGWVYIKNYRQQGKEDIKVSSKDGIASFINMETDTPIEEGQFNHQEEAYYAGVAAAIDAIEKYMEIEESA